MLVAWMSENNTKTWSEGLRFIQSKKNLVLHSGIKTSPYEAMFGTAQRIGLVDSPLTEDMYFSIETEKELEQLFSAEINNGRDMEEVNQQDIQVKMKIKPMTLQNKQYRRNTTKKFTV